MKQSALDKNGFEIRPKLIIGASPSACAQNEQFRQQSPNVSHTSVNPPLSGALIYGLF